VGQHVKVEVTEEVGWEVSHIFGVRHFNIISKDCFSSLTLIATATTGSGVT
jgi:hypothetical protein